MSEPTPSMRPDASPPAGTRNTAAPVTLRENVVLTAAVSGVFALYLLWAWASVLSGPLWRRVLAVLLTFLLSQTLNSIFVLGVARDKVIA